MVRGKEELGGPLEFVHVQKEDDQLQWSTVASSCDSGELRPAAAVVVGDVFENSESDGSEHGQQLSEEVQGVQGGLVNNKNFEVVGQGPLDNSADGMSSSSKGGAECGGGDKSIPGVSAVEVRGLSTSCVEIQGVCVEEGVKVDLVGKQKKVAGFQSGLSGPILSLHDVAIQEAVHSIGPTVSGRAVVELDSDSSPVNFNEKVGPDPGVQIIENLDVMIIEARDKGNFVVNQEYQQENSNLSSSSSSQPCLDQSMNRKGGRIKKPLSRLPFPQIGGPRCLRFADAINNGGLKTRRKVGLSVEGGAPSLTSEECSLEVGEAEATEAAGGVDVEAQAQNGETGSINLVPIQSGLNILLNEADLEDVDGFVNNRKESIAKLSEAEQIFQIQSELGLNFVEGEQQSVVRLMELEERDRKELNNHVEAQGFQ
jgi:hypothetical protein